MKAIYDLGDTLVYGGPPRDSEPVVLRFRVGQPVVISPVPEPGAALLMGALAWLTVGWRNRRS